MATDPTTAIVVGSVLSCMGVLGSVLLNNLHKDRRDAVTDRREEDTKRREELERCHTRIEAQHAIIAAQGAHIAALSATLIAKNIPLPPVPSLLYLSNPE